MSASISTAFAHFKDFQAIFPPPFLSSYDYNLKEEQVFPPIAPSLGFLHLKMPTPVPPEATATAVSCHGCPEDDSICYSCQEERDANDDGLGYCEWRSDATSEIELSFHTESLVDHHDCHPETRKLNDDARFSPRTKTGPRSR